MLSPEQRAEMVAEFNRLVELRRNELKGHAGHVLYNRIRFEQRMYQAAAAALTNETALAEQVRVLREALEDVRAQWPVDYVFRVTEIIDTALALPLPEAARQAAENAEKAGLLEWLTQYSESRFSQWMATYKAGAMLGHIMLLDALRAAKEAGNG